MKNKLIILFTLLILYFTLIGNVDSDNEKIKNNNKPKLKIVIVNSYNYKHPCSSPQVNGFRSGLIKLEKLCDISLVAFDMRSKLVNTTTQAMTKVSQKIIEKINKINPDIVFTTDDNACSYIGIPLSKKYCVISSGLNKPVSKYLNDQYGPKITKDNLIFFVSEYIRLDPLWSLLSQNHLEISTVYLLTENKNNMSTTNYYMLINYIHEFTGNIINIKEIEINNLMELKTVLLTLNTQPKGLIIPVIQRLKDENGIIHDKLDIIKYITQYNSKQLELGGNYQFCKYGLSICIMPDFFLMGKISAQIVNRYIKNKYFKTNSKLQPRTSIISPNRVVVNQERLQDLKYSNLLNNTQLIYKVYDKIKPLK